MLTLTPVALVKASISATKASSSDCTKYFQRSIDSCAPFSGFHGAACAHAFAHPSKAGPFVAPTAANAVPPFTSVRRVNTFMVASSLAVLRVEPAPDRPFEQMDERRIGSEPDLIARLAFVA